MAFPWILVRWFLVVQHLLMGLFKTRQGNPNIMGNRLNFEKKVSKHERMITSSIGVEKSE